MQDDQDYKHGRNEKPPFSTDDKVDTIDRQGPYIQESFDLNRMDNFVTGLGVEYIHYKSIPSPIGKRDRGDYRRSDGVDTITSNGMIYKCAGRFTATMTDNSRDRKRAGAGTMDPSEGLLVMPRFYNKDGGIANGERIYLAPGDRIYVADPKVDVLVSNPQEMDYEQNIHNQPMFPIVRLELPIIDSRNIEYVQGIDFTITKEGDICWLASGKNPGIDPATNKGRIYSVRYLYRAYWYVTQLLKEVRITNVTIDNQRVPERASYHLLVQREYIYHNQNRGSDQNQNKVKDKHRVAQAPLESTDPNKYQVPVQPRDLPSKYTIPVDMSSIGDDEENE
jgi:hypothetical protein